MTGELGCDVLHLVLQSTSTRFTWFLEFINLSRTPNIQMIQDPNKVIKSRTRQGRRSWEGNILLKGECINRAPPIIKLQHVLPCQSVITIMKCIYCLNCHTFGQLIIRKIIRIVDVRFWGQKCTNFDFGWGGPHFGSLQLSFARGTPLTPGCI